MRQLHKVSKVIVCLMLVIIWSVGSADQVIAVPQPSSHMWYVEASKDGMSAKLKKFSLTEKRTVEEIRLPSNRLFGTMVWSPDRAYFAATYGQDARPFSYAADEQGICIFLASGFEVWCQALPLAVFVHRYPFFWSSDSQSVMGLLKAKKAGQDVLQVVRLDLRHKEVTLGNLVEPPIDNPYYFEAWHWLPDGRGAVFALVEWNEKGIGPLPRSAYLLRFTPQQVFCRIEDIRFLTASLFRDEFAYATLSEDQDTERYSTEIKRVDWLSGCSLRTSNLGPVTYEGRDFIVPELSLSPTKREIALVAFSLSYLDYLSGVVVPKRLVVFLQEFEAGTLTKLYEVSLKGELELMEEYDIEQLSWSPDGQYLAATVCYGVRPCEMLIILSRDLRYSIEITAKGMDLHDPTW